MYNTKQREILLNYLNKHHHKLQTAEEISSSLKNENISQSAVYRNLADLEKLGKVRKVIQNGSRKACYQFVDCSNCKGHIHLSCTCCGRTTHLDDADTRLITNNVKSNANFLVSESTIIYGICKNCSKQKENIK